MIWNQNAMARVWNVKRVGHRCAGRARTKMPKWASTHDPLLDHGEER